MEVKAVFLKSNELNQGCPICKIYDAMKYIIYTNQFFPKNLFKQKLKKTVLKKKQIV